MDKRSVVVASEPMRVTCNGRRYYSRAHKDAVIAKCLAPGASLAAVALANGFNANLVRKWVRQWQARQGRPKSQAQMVAVTVQQEQAPAPKPVVGSEPTGAKGSLLIRFGRIELVVCGAVEREQLAVVLDTLLRSQ
jgi:transposase-like protein